MKKASSVRADYVGTTVVETLESRQLRTVTLSIVSASSKDPYFDAQSDPRLPFTVAIRNSGTTDVNYVYTVAFGDLVLTRDKVLGNGDDVTSIGSYNVTSAQHGKTTAVSGTIFPPSTIDSGSYRFGVTLTVVDAMSGAMVKSSFVTQKPAVEIVNASWSGDTISGTSGPDRIVFHEQNVSDYVSMNGTMYRIHASTVNGYFVDGGLGNDKIVADDTFRARLRVTGGGGNDTIVGGPQGDELSGANGRDRITGGAGSDYLLGGAGGDWIDGGAGNDICSGAGGNDVLRDTSGDDYLLGGLGNDVFYVDEGYEGSIPDTVSGGAGEDKASIDYDEVHQPWDLLYSASAM